MGAGKAPADGLGLSNYYQGKIEQLELLIKDKTQNLRRLESQRNELNTNGARQIAVPAQRALAAAHAP
jgi:hypothetical protein